MMTESETICDRIIDQLRLQRPIVADLSGPCFVWAMGNYITEFLLVFEKSGELDRAFRQRFMELRVINEKVRVLVTLEIECETRPLLNEATIQGLIGFISRTVGFEPRVELVGVDVCLIWEVPVRSTGLVVEQTPAEDLVPELYC
jgi:hypothetical protein